MKSPVGGTRLLQLPPAWKNETKPFSAKQKLYLAAPPPKFISKATVPVTKASPLRETSLSTVQSSPLIGELRGDGEIDPDGTRHHGAAGDDEGGESEGGAESGAATH